MRWSSRAIGLTADRGAGWAAVALGFSLPISTALDEILLVLILVLWLAGGRLRDKISAVRHNPTVLPSLLLFGMYIVGLLYGVATPREAMGSLAKAANLLYIPLLLFFFCEERIRRRALAGFLAAVALTILISYLLWTGILPPLALFHITPDDAYTPFKHRITHGFLMAYGAFLFGLQARRENKRPLRIAYAVLGAAALANVLFVVSGRTGYVVALVLGFYFLVCQWRWRGVAAAALLVALLGGAVALMPASVPHRRIAQMAEEVTNWRPGRPEATSVGYRLEYWRNSLTLIGRRPLLGAGTGGFKNAYAALVEGTGMDPSDNPHNEYLMVTVQLGILGLGLMLWLFAVQWKKAALLPAEFAGPAARGLVLVILSASLVTSTLIDHTEGLVYVWMSALLFAAWPAEGGNCSAPCPYPSS